MMLNSLEGDGWLVMEDVSLDRFDTMKAFDELNNDQELLARMEELATGFHRQRAEPLHSCVRRLDALVIKLRELKIEWAEPFLGWILLYRSAIPAWQIPMRCITCLDQIPSPIPVMSCEESRGEPSGMRTTAQR